MLTGVIEEFQVTEAIMIKKISLVQYLSSPTQYIHSPFGDTEAAAKSPPSLLPEEKLFTTCIECTTGSDVKNNGLFEDSDRYVNG